VVGIAKYPVLGHLNNAVNDSRAIKNALTEKHGVDEEDIVYKEDCDSFDLNDAFHEFVEKCKPGDFAFLFYAGHGCAFKDHQCLLATQLSEPVRKLKNGGKYQSILESSLQVQKMLAELRKKKVFKHLLLLDCCRNIQTKDRFRNVEGDEMKDVPPTPFNIKLGPGTTIGYATAPGDCASDGFQSDDGHGFYTEALLKHMHKKNTDVDYMLREVGKEVRKMSRGAQNPYRSSCLNEREQYLFPS